MSHTTSILKLTPQAPDRKNNTTRLRVYACASLLIFPLHNISLAQQSLPYIGQSPATSEVVIDPKTELIKMRREQALLRARSSVADILEMKDVSVKTFAIAALADLIWKNDEPYARELFSKALEFTSGNSELSSDGSKLPASTVAAMRRQIVRRIARHDPALAAHILDEEMAASNRGDRSSRESQRELEIASDLLNDQPSEAIKFAERGLNSGAPVVLMTRLLKGLRLKDEEAANTLFLKTVRQVAADPSSKPNDLLHLGTYVFTSPRIDSSDYAAVAQVSVRGLSVYDITADRPNISASIIRAYLYAAVEKLTRQTSAPKQRQYWYVASYFLLPKVQRFAPDAAPRLAAAMQNLAQDIPGWLTQESSYIQPTASAPKNLDEALREIEKIPDATQRDVRYLALGHESWVAGDFKEARSCATKMSNGDVRAQFNSLIEFGEAAKELERPGPDIGEIERILARLSGGTERALLYLGVARVYVSAKEPQRASEAINAALKAARGIGGARRPYLILAAAGQLAELDSAFAQQLLAEAVKGLNEQDGESLRRVEWQEWIRFGPLPLDFPLNVKGINLGVDDAIRAIVQTDAEGTLATVRLIKDERTRADALVTLTATTFDRVAARQRYMRFELLFPLTEGPPRPSYFAAVMEYGSESLDSKERAQTLKPGDVVRLTFNPVDVRGLKKAVKEHAEKEALLINTANLSAEIIQFDDDSMWAGDEIFRRRKSTGKWQRIGSAFLKPDSLAQHLQVGFSIS